MADLLTRFATVSFVIESLIQSTAGFGVHVIVAEDQSLPAAARFVTYQTTDAVDAAEGLSELTSAAANAARAALTAAPTAGAVTVINQDVTGSAESAEDALDAAEAAGLAFYWITLVSADAGRHRLRGHLRHHQREDGHRPVRRRGLEDGRGPVRVLHGRVLDAACGHLRRHVLPRVP